MMRERTRAGNIFNLSVCIIPLFLFCFIGNTKAQCSFIAPVGDCSSGCTNTLTSGSNINGGQVYCFSGSGTLNNINLNGGTIRICGNLTINNLNINSGIIIVSLTGTLTISQNKFFNGNVQLINHGQVNINANLTLQNANNYIYNDNTYNQTGQLRLNSSTSYFINDLGHVATINDLFINSGVLCLEDNSVLTVNSLTNNQNNTASFSSLSGYACVRITGSAQINAGSFSTSPEIGVCLANGVSLGGGGGWGAVRLFNNCNSCSAPLPVELINFSAKQFNNEIDIVWTTASEINNNYFVIEKSHDTKYWDEITQVSGMGSSNKTTNYKYIDNNPFKGTSYYRLKQVDFNGQNTFSSIEYVNLAKRHQEISMYPNPFHSELVIKGSELEIQTIKLYDIAGRDVSHKIKFNLKGKNKLVLGVNNLGKGFYLIKTQTTTTKVYKE